MPLIGQGKGVHGHADRPDGAHGEEGLHELDRVAHDETDPAPAADARPHQRAADGLDPILQSVVAQPAIAVDDRLVPPEAFGHRTNERADGNLTSAYGCLADAPGAPPPCLLLRHTC